MEKEQGHVFKNNWEQILNSLFVFSFVANTLPGFVPDFDKFLSIDGRLSGNNIEILNEMVIGQYLLLLWREKSDPLMEGTQMAVEFILLNKQAPLGIIKLPVQGA